MRTLSVLAAEDGAIVAVTDTGERFRIPIDDDLRALLHEQPAPTARRLTPREIQAQVRAGLTPQQVAAVSGAPLAYVERFVGPVLAERRWIADSALSTRLPAGEDGVARTFGAVMAERLAALDADGVRWSSAKEMTGWVVHVAFAADGVEHDARWRFDTKRQQLAPENVEAATLSQEGVPAALTPRLRAIEPTGPVRVAPVTPVPPAVSKFDSQAFVLPDLAPEPAAEASDLPPTQAMPSLPAARAAHRASVPVATAAPDATAATASAPVAPIRQATPPAPVTRLPDRPLPAAEDDAGSDEPDVPARPASRPVAGRRGRPRDGRRTTRGDENTATRPVSLPGRGRTGRTSMPSWDEIVFGRDED